MTTLDKKIIATNLRRRAYVKPTVDPIQDAVVISEKVRNNNGCLAFIGVLVTAAVIAAWMFGAKTKKTCPVCDHAISEHSSNGCQHRDEWREPFGLCTCLMTPEKFKAVQS
jgi:hypothetical protein